MPSNGQGRDDRDNQIAALTEIIGTVAGDLRRLEGRVKRLATTLDETTRPADDESEATKPAPWVWFPPPAAAEDNPDAEQDARATVTNFVTWYNSTFAGIDGSRAHPIPPCWPQHPALAMEIASLTYAWRTGNIGPSANARDAQQWLHQWRPGFSERLARDWVHADCLDGDHRAGRSVPATIAES